MKHHLQCILACICILLRQGRGNSLICNMKMGSVSPTPGAQLGEAVVAQYVEDGVVRPQS